MWRQRHGSVCWCWLHGSSLAQPILRYRSSQTSDAASPFENNDEDDDVDDDVDDDDDNHVDNKDHNNDKEYDGTYYDADVLMLMKMTMFVLMGLILNFNRRQQSKVR